MAFKKLKLTGNLYWAKVFPFNREMVNFQGDIIKHKHSAELVSDEDAGEYKVEIHLSKEEAAKVKQAGCKQSPRKDKDTGFPKEFDDGYAYTFTRLHCVPKAPKAGGPVKVTWADGREYDTEEAGLIGNGTKGTLVIDVSTGTGKNDKGQPVDFTRANLAEVIVHDLVTYVKDGDEPAKEPAKNPGDLDDEIPF